MAPLLKRGFRHVFVALQSGDYWIRVDGMDGVPVAEVVAAADYDLVTFYRAEGFVVLERETGEDRPRGPFALANCVGLTKAMLGLRSPFALTPHGLYRHLRNTR